MFTHLINKLSNTSMLRTTFDVYGFGVVLLELVSGRKAVQDGINLVDWAASFIQDLEDHERAAHIMDPSLGEAMMRVLNIVKNCVQRLRSNMSIVYQDLLQHQQI